MRKPEEIKGERGSKRGARGTEAVLGACCHSKKKSII